MIGNYWLKRCFLDPSRKYVLGSSLSDQFLKKAKKKKKKIKLALKQDTAKEEKLLHVEIRFMKRKPLEGCLAKNGQ